MAKCTTVTPGPPYATPGALVTLTHLATREPDQDLLEASLRRDGGVGERHGCRVCGQVVAVEVARRGLGAAVAGEVLGGRGAGQPAEAPQRGVEAGANDPRGLGGVEVES